MTIGREGFQPPLGVLTGKENDLSGGIGAADLLGRFLARLAKSRFAAAGPGEGFALGLVVRFAEGFACGFSLRFSRRAGFGGGTARRTVAARRGGVSILFLVGHSF